MTICSDALMIIYGIKFCCRYFLILPARFTSQVNPTTYAFAPSRNPSKLQTSKVPFPTQIANKISTVKRQSMHMGGSNCFGNDRKLIKSVEEVGKEGGVYIVFC
jgi:hypothetical protein